MNTSENFHEQLEIDLMEIQMPYYLILEYSCINIDKNQHSCEYSTQLLRFAQTVTFASS